MSDRLVFVPFDGEPYDWADVVVVATASHQDIRDAGSAFASLPGPHKVFVADRQDPRFIELMQFLDREFSMTENDEFWGYTVKTRRARAPS